MGKPAKKIEQTHHPVRLMLAIPLFGLFVLATLPIQAAFRETSTTIEAQASYHWGPLAFLLPLAALTSWLSISPVLSTQVSGIAKLVSLIVAVGFLGYATFFAAD